MGTRWTGLWRHPDFLKLWAGETVSLFGSQLTFLAVPLTAAVILGASPAQMGLLSALEFAPFLLFGLPAGAWVDRLPRRPVLITANLCRAALLATIPLASWLDLLRIGQLLIVGFLVGVGTVFFDVAYQSYLPVLVGREQLVEGNSKLETSLSLAQVAGPGLGGALVQLLTAPAAILFDAVSFLVSAACLRAIRTPEPPVAATAAESRLGAEIREGIGLIVGNPVLRGIAGCTATSNLFGSIAQSAYVLYCTRTLSLSPAQLGIAYAAFGPGGLAGAFLAPRLARRLGLGRTLVAGMSLAPICWTLVLLAGGSPARSLVLLVAGNMLLIAGGTIYNINQLSLRQAITPDRLLGRMNASMRFLVWGTIPAGALLGGALGEAFGLRAAITVGGMASVLAPLWLLLTPARSVRQPGVLNADSDSRAPAPR